MTSGRIKFGVASHLLVAAAVFGFARSQGDPAPAPGVTSRLSTARDAFKSIDDMRAAGQHLDTTKYYVWSKRLMEAEREAAGGKLERVAATRAHVDRMNKLMWDSRLQFEHSELSRLEFLDAQFHYEEAAAWLEKESAR